MPEPGLATESIVGRRARQEGDGGHLLAVADGMGGHAAGQVASALAVESLVQAIEAGHGLEEAFRRANQRVHDQSREPGKHGMGTTMVAACLRAGTCVVANVGDSRAYALSASGIRQLTEDHSFVAEAVNHGHSEEEARASRWREALTRAIGTEPHVQVDVFGPDPVEADTAILLCSDGLYKTLGDADVHRLFVGSHDPEGAAKALVTAAYERGSDDNISVVIAEFGNPGRERYRE